MPSEGPHIWIRFQPDRYGGMFIVGDEDGEFARAGHGPTAAHYVDDLIAGAMSGAGLDAEVPRG